MQKTTIANENLSDSGTNVHITLSRICRPLPPSILEVIATCFRIKWAAPFIKLWFSLGFNIAGNIWNSAILVHNSAKCITLLARILTSFFMFIHSFNRYTGGVEPPTATPTVKAPLCCRGLWPTRIFKCTLQLSSWDRLWTFQSLRRQQNERERQNCVKGVHSSFCVLSLSGASLYDFGQKFLLNVPQLEVSGFQGTKNADCQELFLKNKMEEGAKWGKSKRFWPRWVVEDLGIQITWWYHYKEIIIIQQTNSVISEQWSKGLIWSASLQYFWLENIRLPYISSI